MYNQSYVNYVFKRFALATGACECMVWGPAELAPRDLLNLPVLYISVEWDTSSLL